MLEHKMPRSAKRFSRALICIRGLPSQQTCTRYSKRRARLTHQVQLLDESEIYKVGNEVGLTGRFVRNVCDPVMKSLQPFEEMDSIRFGDFQAISSEESTSPDVCFGLVDDNTDTTNVYLVGELKTPWTISRNVLLLNQPNPPLRLEPLLGQVVSQMRTCKIRFGFLSTYDWTVFVRREADDSFLLSPPIGHRDKQPSVRQLLTAFSLMALREPKYEESPGFQSRTLRDPPPTRFSSQTAGNADRQPPPEQTEENIPTSQSILVDTGRPRPAIVNCVRRLTDPDNQQKATWQANMDGSPVVIKCWALEKDELWEAESEVYNRICVGRQHSRRCFANWVSRGQIVCSSIFRSGYALILQERPGIRLDLLWRRLNNRERTHIQAEVFHGIRVIRRAGLRLNDPGQHNILYDRESWEVTMLDFENVVQNESGTFLSDYFEMEIIFGDHLSLGRQGGG